MTRSLLCGMTMLLTSCTAFAASDQFKQQIEHNLRLLEWMAGSQEGYAGTLEGSSLVYSSYRPEPHTALITRASTGAMAIAWRTPPVPSPLPAGDVRFVVMAGMYGQSPSGFTFTMDINGIPRFTFVTTPEGSWEVAGKDGGTLRFSGILRDKYNDLFGCLLITAPSSWLTPGEPVQMRITGEKADNAAWFMVFEAPDVIAYQRELTQHQSYCNVLFRGDGPQYTITLEAPSDWHGRDVRLTPGGGRTLAGQFTAAGGSSSVTLQARHDDLTPPLTVHVNGEFLMRLDTLFAATGNTIIYPMKVVVLSASRPDETGWLLTYQSTYHPGLGTSLQELSRISGGQGTQHLIISTHQDIAWMDSPEQCILDRDEKIITPLLGIMKDDPTYHFDLEDVLCLREYVERHPARKDEIHRYMTEGRLGIGASFNQPYEDLCSGEMLARQFYAGRRWLRTHFPGCDSKTYWNPDVPGRTLQMSQVLRKAGVEYLVMSRFEKGLYSWFSPDGSSVLAFSPGHYADFKARVEATGFEQAAGYVAATSGAWLKRTGFAMKDLPLVSMSDMSGPDRYDTFITKWRNARTVAETDGSIAPLSLPPVQYSLAGTYLDAVAPAKAGFPVVRGERPNIWLYIHGPTHHWAISAKREADALLPAAETFNTVDALLHRSFRGYPQEELTRAWEAQLYPDHGWGGKNGEITDSTFRASYETARDIAQRLLFRSLGSIASRVKTDSASGVPVLIFNALSWKRSGPVQAGITLQRGVAREALALYDGKGDRVPAQVAVTHRHADGSIAMADLTFTAHELPPVGYATFYVRPAPPTPPAQGPSPAAPVTLENRYYRIVLGAGGAREIVDKELQESLLEPGRFTCGELFTMESVGEDAGEWGEPQQPTMEGFDKLGDHPTSWRSVESGPVRDVVEARYALQHTAVVQRIILYHTIKRIDVEVSLLGWNGTRYREFRLAFPLRGERDRVAYEVPFGVMEVGKSEMQGAAGERYGQTVSHVRPRSIQNWIGVSGARHGVTISSSVAVWDYQDPTDPEAGRLLLQPVLLASRRSCHGEGPWYLQAGDHHFRFSLTSHAPGWQHGHRQGVEPNMPLFAVVAPPGDSGAHLAGSGSFLSVGAENAVLSTMKKSEDGEAVVVRLYDITGRGAKSSIGLFTPVRTVEETNLIEDVVRAVPLDNERTVVPIDAHGIHTFRITPRW